jgi:hypothetical protein
MPGLVPGIHAVESTPASRPCTKTLFLVFKVVGCGTAWMAGRSPAMTASDVIGLSVRD